MLAKALPAAGLWTLSRGTLKAFKIGMTTSDLLLTMRILIATGRVNRGSEAGGMGRSKRQSSALG